MMQREIICLHAHIYATLHYTALHVQAYWMLWKSFKVCNHYLFNHVQVSDQDMGLPSNIKTIKEKRLSF